MKEFVKQFKQADSRQQLLLLAAAWKRDYKEQFSEAWKADKEGRYEEAAELREAAENAWGKQDGITTAIAFLFNEASYGLWKEAEATASEMSAFEARRIISKAWR